MTNSKHSKGSEEDAVQASIKEKHYKTDPRMTNIYSPLSNIFLKHNYTNVA